MEDKLLNGFINPNPDYRPATMWFWNDELLESEITAQLLTMKEQGINEFFVNHVWGATDDYLGERFFDMVKYAVKEAKRLGMYFWMYDEFNWPSGAAGGKLLRDKPWTRLKLLKEIKASVEPCGKLENLYVQGKFHAVFKQYPDAPEAGIIDVSADAKIDETEHGYYITYDNNTNTTITLRIMSAVLYDVVLPASKWGKYSFNQQGYIDVFNPDAIRAFIDSTHEKYKEAIGDEFGKTVRGIFTDEVSIGYGVGFGIVPWMDGFEEKFKARWGYELKPFLPIILGLPKTPIEKQARWHFWQFAAETFHDAYIGQVAKWCENENIIYTGHFNGEEAISYSMTCTGDFFKVMKMMGLPGIDSIYSRERIEEEHFNIAPKVVASCAKYYGKDRVLCETYTMSGNLLRFDEMRRVANRLLTYGINMIQFMGSNYSINNGRKAPSPLAGYPSHSDNNTMFRHYKYFTDYLSRIQYISAMTKPAGKVLLLWPIAGMTVLLDGFDSMGHVFHSGRIRNYRPAEPADSYELTEIGLVNALCELNIEYDMFSDGMANDLTAENGRVTFWGSEYDTVILPQTTDTTSEVYAMAERLKAANINTIFVNGMPEVMVDKGEASKLYGEAPTAEGLHRIAENISLINVSDAEKHRENNGHLKEMLLSVIGSDHVTLNITHDGGINTGLRTGDGKTVVIMSNDTFEEKHAEFDFREGMKLLAPDTGCTVTPNVVNGRASITFAPYDLYILVEDECDGVSDNTIPATVELKKLPEDCELSLEGGSRLRCDWSYSPYTEGMDLTKAPESAQPIPTGYIPSPYAHANCTGLLTFTFEADAVPTNAVLFIEHGDVNHCELNGISLDDRFAEVRLWGPHNAKASLEGCIREGTNTLSVVFTTPDYNMPYLVPFGFICGDFETDGTSVTCCRNSVKPAPINGQGHPEFCGDASYIFKVTLTEEEANSAAYLKAETREAAELVINGKPAGKRLWTPYRFNTEGLFKAGENTVELKTTLPMWNFFCAPEQRADMGLLGTPIIEKIK